MLQRPLKNYPGGKSGNGTYQTIINHIPQCRIFIDAMVGNGGIVSKIKLPGITVINDMDSGLIDLYNYSGHGKFIKENKDVLVLIDEYDIVSSQAFFYFDPPYLKSSRKNEQDLYKFEWSMSDHEKFISKALTVKNNCMISHYPCSLYDTAFKHWHSVKFQSATRHGLAEECIYMNYYPPYILQDYQYTGIDFTDRQRIKRKIARLIKKLDALPEVERTYLIKSIIDKNLIPKNAIINGLGQ